MKSFDFEGKLIAITGKNGSGKTNILDAIYYLCFTKSYFNNKEILNVHSGTAGFRIAGHFTHTDNTIEKIIAIYKDQKKIFQYNDSTYEKLADHIGKYQAVMIAPDDMKIIVEGSEYRRKFIDGILSQSHPSYLQALLQYQKYLQQKNAFLKQHGLGADIQILQFYNQQLLQLGTELIHLRQLISAELLPFVNTHYQQLCLQAEAIQIQYIPNIEVENWATMQAQRLHQEMEAGRSLIGPHLDDWHITINGLPAKTQSSQGQKKSMLLALKLSQVSLLTQQGKEVILLLDDVFEKLDPQRLQQLFLNIQTMPLSQIFATHTNAADIYQYIQPHFPAIQLIHL